MADFLTTLTNLALQYGYLGVFGTALLGSVVPFLPVPYLIIVVLLSNRLDPLALGIAAGLGATVGKTTSYFLGRSGYLLSKGSTKKKMDTLRSLAGKYGDLAVFIFALTPLPDDVCFVPIGVMRFPFWRFLLANAAGKLGEALFVAYFGRAYFTIATGFLGVSEILAMIIALVLTLVVTILLLRVDWDKVARDMIGSSQVKESQK